MADGDDHAPFGRPVEFGQDDAGAVDSFGELAGLTNAVLPGGGVKHQQHLMRRGRNLFAYRVLNLRQLCHQIALRLESACRIDNADIGLLFDGLLDSTVRDRSGMGALLPGDDVDSKSLRPDCQLLNRGGAKCIAGAKDDAVAFVRRTS